MLIKISEESNGIEHSHSHVGDELLCNFSELLFLREAIGMRVGKKLVFLITRIGGHI